MNQYYCTKNKLSLNNLNLEDFLTYLNKYDLKMPNIKESICMVKRNGSGQLKLLIHRSIIPTFNRWVMMQDN